MAQKIIRSQYHLYDEKIDTMAEVPDSELKPLPKNKDLKVIGKSIPRIDGNEKVTGAAIYTFDKTFVNIAHGRTLRSPYPFATITKIDTSKAEKLKGVIKIIHTYNTNEISWYWGNSKLFDKTTRYEGEEVAFVVAETEAIAEKAVRLIKVEYKELDFVINPVDAAKEDAPKIHEGGNIPKRRGHSTYSRGDFEEGIKNADVVVEEKYITEVAVHNPTEPFCSVVKWDDEQLTIWDSTQGIFSVRDSIASSLKIPQSKVRVITEYMGGGFGAKLEAGKYSVMAALVSKEIKRPVKVVLDRREMNLAVGNRPNSYQTIKVGAKRDGTLMALGLTNYGSMGAYPAGAGAHWPLRSLYKCENVTTSEYSVFTNTGRARAFRAPGHVQGTFALESILDDVAEKLKINPLDFRIKNFAPIDQDSERPYTSKKLLEAYEVGAKAIGWENRKTSGSDKGFIKRGFGLASQIWWGGGYPPAYATVKMNRDGSVQVLCGTQDLGTGTYTIIAQVAAEVLEIPIEKIDVLIGDTQATPYAPSSGGSNTAPSITPAVYDGALQIKEKLMSGASALLEVSQEKLVYSKGEIFESDNKSNSLKASEIVRKMRERVLVATGSRNESTSGYRVNTFGVQFADVEVNTLTGKIKVNKIVAAHDIGRTLNRQTLENQFHGGVIMGLSYALHEERVVDEFTGKVVNANLLDYKIATMLDTPEIDVIIVSEADELVSAVGAKGIGEPAIIPTPGAIANAVYNAIGVRINSLPITPDKVLMALNKEV
ncbi:MAG: xanthine dehydrogenase family protein molybdopterin-binding subunit [Melioribacteraceae bacterium]|nr:xanthine dehydrogenase family protein molybdopterin-binding subunit [Melioribacteraceae bacterium]